MILVRALAKGPPWPVLILIRWTCDGAHQPAAPSISFRHGDIVRAYREATSAGWKLYGVYGKNWRQPHLCPSCSP